ncbi:hypothetical protein GGI15_002005 [Coemansia interrupta]|uniref:Uncharacterized protein n=1 Tax=Coemansia interrupta TaxID=1126814 RepID=A0A9W8HNT2_9FUNG|nr:hypothetical protein GGI15_002005 [Coemansia interrupta]
MRYNSPITQLSIVAVTLVLTTAVRRLLRGYILQETPEQLNLGYNREVVTSIVEIVSSFLGIFIVNLIESRFIFLFYTLTNIIYASSFIVMYRNHSSIYEHAAEIINMFGYSISRVATLVIVLAYPGEKWKARALAVFLILEYLSAAIGDLIAVNHSDSESRRYSGAIIFLCFSCVAPFAAMFIAPSQNIVRNSGVYLLTPSTNLTNEIREIVGMFANRYMLLLIPYMLIYPMLFGFAFVQLPDTRLMVLFDFGKVLVIFLGQMLDIKWAGRRTRGIVGLAVVFVVFLASFGTVAASQYFHYNFSGLDPSWSYEQQREYMIGQVILQAYPIISAATFFAGMVSGLIELYGYWVMGTLTNDLKSSARFVGIYHSIMALGGFIGFQISEHNPDKSKPMTTALFVGSALTLVSFALALFVVRRITETNDWSLAKIEGHSTDDIPVEPANDMSPVDISDIKYHHRAIEAYAM